MNILIILLVIQTAISFYCIAKLIFTNRILLKERQRSKEANETALKKQQIIDLKEFEIGNCLKRMNSLKLDYDVLKESYDNNNKVLMEFLNWSKQFINITKELKKENLKLRNIVAELNNQLNNEKSEQQN